MSRRAPAGFTIIEILVALTLLAVVILLVTRAFLTILSVTSQGGRVTVASALATRQVERIRALVEAQETRKDWREKFCGVAAEPITPFPAPHAAYSYQVLIDDKAVAETGQADLLLPCWSIGWARTGCLGQPGYVGGNCAADSTLGQDDRLRWVTVEVFFHFQEGAQPLARMTTAIIRGAYHR